MFEAASLGDVERLTEPLAVHPASVDAQSGDGFTDDRASVLDAQEGGDEGTIAAIADKLDRCQWSADSRQRPG